MEKYIDAIISLIKAEDLDVSDCNQVIASLSECVAGQKLIRVYMANTPRFRVLLYSYELND